VTQEVKAQLHKLLHWCKQGRSKLRGCGDREVPLGQPHRRSHHAVRATNNTGALERFRREEASLSPLGVQMRCCLFPSRLWLAFRQEFCFCLGSVKD